jgi:hypothetical protein
VFWRGACCGATSTFFVGDQGYEWPEDQILSNEILRQLAAEHPKRRFFLVSAPGWYGSELVLPGKVFSPPEAGRTTV